MLAHTYPIKQSACHYQGMEACQMARSAWLSSSASTLTQLCRVCVFHLLKPLV